MASNDVALRQFLRTLKHGLRADSTLADTERVLDKWTIIGCQALYFERRDLVDIALKLLHEAYVALPVAGPELTEKRLAVVVRLYALGSLAVRLGDWGALRPIVLRPAKIHPADNDYVHSSWIRHGHVEAARAGLTKDDDDTGAYLISASRRLMMAQPSVRPDVPEALVSHTGNPASDDALLNSLCQFEIFYCLLVLTEGQTSVRSMYPSSAAFDETRADPALVLVAGDSAVRATVFPNSNDVDVAAAVYNVVRLIMQEAFNFGGRWWGPPPSVQAFLIDHGQPEV
jgi:hypothetical protein